MLFDDEHRPRAPLQHQSELLLKGVEDHRRFDHVLIAWDNHLIAQTPLEDAVLPATGIDISQDCAVVAFAHDLASTSQPDHRSDDRQQQEA